MARYLEIAKSAQSLIDVIMKKIPEDVPYRDTIIADLAYLYNLGIRTAPRPVQSTVRLRAVQAAIKSQPLKAVLEEKEGRNGKTFNYLRLYLVTPTSAGSRSLPPAQVYDDPVGGDSDSSED